VDRPRCAATPLPHTRSSAHCHGSGCRVHGSGFRVQGSGFRVQGLGFRAHHHTHDRGRTAPPTHPIREREFFIDNLLVRIHCIIVVIRWTGLAPWEFQFLLPGSLTSTFLTPSACERTARVPGLGIRVSGFMFRVGGFVREEVGAGDLAGCRANMAHIRQSRPDSGCGFQVKVLKTFQVFPSSLGSGTRHGDTPPH